MQVILNWVIFEVTKDCENRSNKGNQDNEQVDPIAPPDLDTTSQHRSSVKPIGLSKQIIPTS